MAFFAYPLTGTRLKLQNSLQWRDAGGCSATVSQEVEHVQRHLIESKKRLAVDEFIQEALNPHPKSPAATGE